MTTFKQYLLEAESPDLSGFTRNIQTMLDNKIYLYRGTATQRSDFKIKDATAHSDYSAFIASERTIERTPKGSRVAGRLSSTWQVPERKLSYFVTRDASHADNFGKLMLVIPSDSVELYAWSATDFNQGPTTLFKRKLMKVELSSKKALKELFYFVSGFYNKDELAVYLVKFLDKTGIKPDELKTLFVESEQGIRLIDLLISNIDKLAKLEGFGKSTLLEALNDIQDVLEDLDVESVEQVYKGANQASFKIKSFKNLNDIPPKPATSDELWFNGKYLAVFLDSRHTAEKDSTEVLKLLLSKE